MNYLHDGLELPGNLLIRHSVERECFSHCVRAQKIMNGRLVVCVVFWGGSGVPYWDETKIMFPPVRMLVVCSSAGSMLHKLDPVCQLGKHQVKTAERPSRNHLGLAISHSLASLMKLTTLNRHFLDRFSRSLECINYIYLVFCFSSFSLSRFTPRLECNLWTLSENMN